MIRLIIDTSGGIATTILTRDADLIGVASTRGSVLALLHANIKQVLDASDMPIDQIEEVCVVTGPGSWTGLHVGVTTAKTIVQYLGIPLVELSMLDALAYTLPATSEPILTVLDARRECVYSACYSWKEEVLHALIPPAKRHIGETMRLAAEQGEKLILAGDHVKKTARQYLPHSITIDSGVSYPSAQAFIALSSYRSEARVTGAAIFDIVPDYMGEDFTITPSSKVIR
jgi:tRNA threonylcarbamoyladenosine biosynthesis protein TsaB